ncbi:O-antigen ligase family protein [Vibrio hippocampi]|uniref:O-antigen ligase-related domain-containing protein n=1 Tax=Vibrio hippocampi TaxID=654686 RepID=A0ABM8ZL70_9VIBR|nr:O-antigen ligase family protein [Vibrio hippocampi]CAH0529058.1 hypothetical protein VHP8226_03029 [Vibrio hippocampi]
MNYQIKISTLKTAFTLFGIAFFTKLINGIDMLVSSGGTEPYIENAAGSLMNKAFGSFILLVCLILAFRYKRLKPILTDGKNLAFILFCLYALASVIWSVEPAVSMRRVIFFFAVVAFAYYLVEMYSYKTVFRFIGYTIGACALFSLITMVIIPEKVTILSGPRAGAVKGIFVDKNGAARTYMAGLAMLVPLVLNRDRKAIFFSACMAIMLFATRSVSGIFLTFIALATTGYFYYITLSGALNKSLVRYKVRFALITYISGLTVAYLMYAVLLELVGRDATLTNRTLIWELILPSVYDKLALGWGFGAYWASWGVQEFMERWGYIGNAHNGFIETLLHGGIPFLVLLVITIIAALYQLLKYQNLRQRPLENYICISLIIVYTIANFVGYTLPNHNAVDFFIFSYIVLLSTKYVGSRQGSYDSKQSRLSRIPKIRLR